MSDMEFVEVPKVPRKVRAVRWTGHQDDARLKALFEGTSWQVSFSVGELALMVDGERVGGKALFISTQHGGHSVPPGSWIVVGEDGSLTTRFDDQFRSEYVPA